MKSIKIFVFATALLFGVAAFAPSLPALADSPSDHMKEGLKSIDGTTDDATFSSTLQTLINAFLFIIGALSVLMIIYGGFKYVTSAGESSALSSAKNTIMYAVVGLVVAMLAWGIASFVVTTLDSSPAKDAGQGASDSVNNAAGNADTGGGRTDAPKDPQR